jgi:putative acetyltransferase
MILIRPEKADDIHAIDDLLDLAFAFDAHSSQNEAEIVRQLRKSGELLLSLVAIDPGGELVGQIAFSPVCIDDGTPAGLPGWVGLGPLSVNPRLQRQGIGRQLMDAGLAAMQTAGYSGCVVLGEPGFYEHFGFATCENLILPGALAPYFLAQAFAGALPSGFVRYADAFSV